MPLTLSHTHWAAMARAAEEHPTCKLTLHLHEGCVRRISVEHSVVCETAEERSGTGSDGVGYGVEVQRA